MEATFTAAAAPTSSFDHILTILGAFVPLASALASFVNHRVRQAIESGTEAPKALLAAGSVLNMASVNVDKAVQLAKMLATVEQAKVVPTVPPAADVAVCPTCGK